MLFHPWLALIQGGAEPGQPEHVQVICVPDSGGKRRPANVSRKAGISRRTRAVLLVVLPLIFANGTLTGLPHSSLLSCFAMSKPYSMRPAMAVIEKPCRLPSNAAYTIPIYLSPQVHSKSCSDTVAGTAVPKMLGLPAPLSRALTARNIENPSAIQAEAISQL